jgi:hypothetical protein
MNHMTRVRPYLHMPVTTKCLAKISSSYACFRHNHVCAGTHVYVCASGTLAVCGLSFHTHAYVYTCKYPSIRIRTKQLLTMLPFSTEDHGEAHRHADVHPYVPTSLQLVHTVTVTFTVLTLAMLCRDLPFGGAVMRRGAADHCMVLVLKIHRSSKMPVAFPFGMSSPPYIHTMESTPIILRMRVVSALVWLYLRLPRIFWLFHRHTANGCGPYCEQT